MKRIVVLGGGVGGSGVVRALLKLPDIHVTCLVNTTDNGGHSGEIRRLLGIIPVGDLRRVICIMLPPSVRSQYEFRNEEGVVGNKILAEMISTKGVVEGILAFISTFPEFPIDRLNVWPISATPTDLCMTVGKKQYRGQLEVMFDRPKGSFGEFTLDPAVELLAEAETAISKAEVIIIAPSGIVGSVAPILLTEKVRELIQCKRLVWFAPLFSLPADGPNPWANYMRSIVSLAKTPDLIVANSTPLPEKVRKLYQERGFYLIKPEENTSNLQTSALLEEIPGEPPGVVASPFPRYFIHVQHDVDRLRTFLSSIL